MEESKTTSIVHPTAWMQTCGPVSFQSCAVMGEEASARPQLAWRPGGRPFPDGHPRCARSLREGWARVSSRGLVSCRPKAWVTPRSRGASSGNEPCAASEERQGTPR